MRALFLPGLAAALVLAIAPEAALAQRPAAGPDATFEERRARHREVRERVQRRLRLYRTVELAEALSLSEAEAVRLSAEMQKFDDRREALRETLREAWWTAKQASKGDAEAAKRLDATFAAATKARQDLAAVDLDEYRTLAKLVPADRHGRLALFLLQFPQRVQELVHEARKGLGPGEAGEPGAGPPGPGRRGPAGLDDPFGP